MAEKGEKLDLVSLTIIRELVNLERPRMNVQKIARATGVSRSWIYKYFGASEEEMVLSAIDFLAPKFTDHGKITKDSQGPKAWAATFLKSLDLALEKVETFPEIYRFIFGSMIYQDNYAARIRHHELSFKENFLVPQIIRVFGMRSDEARSFADLVLSLRLGVMLHWLRESERTPAKKKKLLREIRKSIFDQYHTPS